MQKLRLLSFDDLYLLSHLLNGQTLTGAAKSLGLTQPAITQRVRKIEGVFSCELLAKSGRNVRLTNEGRHICTKAVGALALMGELTDDSMQQVVRVGTRPEAGFSWLWPALARLRKSHPSITYHLHFGSGEEILSQLGIGSLDAVLTSAPLTTKDFDSVELAIEEYIFVAHPNIAKTIKKLEDLSEYVFIEHDRSFPFLRYVNPQDRAKLKFKDVWFVGSTVAMAKAVADGFGVGIVPRYIADEYMDSKTSRLKALDLDLDIASDFFRLVFRKERDLETAMKLLSDLLIKDGLR